MEETAVAIDSVTVTDVGSDTDSRAVETELVEELLVEEISIDGMCGVY